MPNETEKLFESKIEEYLISDEGGWKKADDSGFCSEEYRGMALDIVTLTDFVKASQPLAWKRFERMCTINPIRQFYKAFESAVQQQGLVDVLRHGFKHRGVQFTVCYFQPESTLNAISLANYQKNICQCVRQWHYSETNTNTVDMMLAINGIPVIALELKNQLTGQTIDDAIRQWQYNRDPKEPTFGFNRRILAYLAVDLYQVSMTTQLEREKTRFLPFNQGTNGAGRDGGAGNPPTKDGDYVTSYLWHNVLQKDKLLDILQKFISLEKTEVKSKNPDGTLRVDIKERLIFPRYHGVGDRLGPIILAEIGDIRRFHSGKALNSYTGNDAPPYQSGQFESKNRHISKRGSPALRKACFEVMQALKLTKPQDDPVYLFMLKKEQDGKAHNVAKMAGINKFLRIYYARAMALYK